MNDDDQTALTEFCPEAGYLQRMNFLTEDVKQKLIFFVLVKRLRETGKFDRFWDFAAWKHYEEFPDYIPERPLFLVIFDWLLDPARFAGLVAEFVKAHP